LSVIDLKIKIRFQIALITDRNGMLDVTSADGGVMLRGVRFVLDAILLG
jgi:hypothetical protein